MEEEKKRTDVDGNDDVVWRIDERRIKSKYRMGCVDRHVCLFYLCLDIKSIFVVSLENILCLLLKIIFRERASSSFFSKRLSTIWK